MQVAERIKLMAVVLLLVFSPFSTAWAYVGPGVGITMLWAFWAALAVILAAVGGLLVWPARAFRRWQQRRSGQKRGHDTDNE
jgi:membrane protein implicated in regulation of membrane protease activity